MACEQTFTWLSRHKKILYAMHKCHLHFYLHRMVKCRNKYITIQDKDLYVYVIKHNANIFSKFKFFGNNIILVTKALTSEGKRGWLCSLEHAARPKPKAGRMQWELSRLCHVTKNNHLIIFTTVYYGLL